MFAKPPFSRAAACAGIVVALATSAFAACSDGPTNPPPATGIRLIRGAALTDSIDAQLTAPLVVEVRRANGELAVGAQVRFEPQPSSDPTRTDRTIFVCSVELPVCSFGSTRTDTTNAAGQVSATVRLGRVAGQAVIKILVPALGFVDSATYTVVPGAATAVRPSTTDTSLVFGATATLRGRVVDRALNPRPEVVTLSIGTGAAITLNAATGLVTAQQLGMQWVYVRDNTRVDSIMVRVVPPGRLVGAVGSEIRMVNTDGSNVRTIATGVIGGLGPSPRFDPSRKLVSYQDGTSFVATIVGVVDTLGAPRRLMDATVGLNSILAARVLSDGSLLVLAQRTPVQGYTLFRVESDNSLTTLLDVPGLRSTAGSADISPDGTKIAYAVPAAPTGLPELRVIQVATGSITILEPTVSSPRWSMQGDKIGYIASGGLAIVNPDGSGRRLVAAGSLYGPLCWSADATYLVATAEVSFNRLALRVFRVSNGASVDLQFRSATGAVENYRQPDWR